MSVAKTSERFWRCAQCGHECYGGLAHTRGLPMLAATCAGTLEKGEHQPAIMVLVEQEHVYPSESARLLLENMEHSDWGLLRQASEHYAQHLRRSVARRNPPAGAVLARGVYPRLEAIARVLGLLAAHAPRDTEGGGRIVELAARRAQAR